MAHFSAEGLRAMTDEQRAIARCHGGSCHYDIDSYDNGNIACRNCGEGAITGGGCDDKTPMHCTDRCHYEIVGGGYLCDAPSHTLRCVHCGNLALID
jgi:hypothetical protein